jgi:hypothetical protein
MKKRELGREAKGSERLYWVGKSKAHGKRSHCIHATPPGTGFGVCGSSERYVVGFGVFSARFGRCSRSGMHLPPLSHLAISLHLLLLSKLKYEMVGTACACGVPSPQANFVSHSLTHSLFSGRCWLWASASPCPPPPSPPAPAPALFFSSLFYLFIYLFVYSVFLFRALLVFFWVLLLR